MGKEVNQGAKLCFVSLTDVNVLVGAAEALTILDTPYAVDEDELNSYIEDEIHNELDRFDFLNVMLVRETSRIVTVGALEGLLQDLPVHERVGVGIVHSDALGSLGTLSWLEMVLG